MYRIFAVNSHATVDFAAQELKKYLRMMLPRAGEIPVSYAPRKQEGFRLGLVADFGLSCDVKDPGLDDVIYIKTDENGGILAGSNPRSVLIAVYQYLKKNGCDWLFPGPDGEKIPLVEALAPVDYIHKASCRYRGQCNEGGETQPLMLDAIDFAPKAGMNIFMLEFDIPRYYYDRAYQHKYGCVPPEAPLSNETVLRWKREREAEIARRSLQFHDMGHGWTAEPFGFDCSGGWDEKGGKVTEENRRHLAQIGGVRDLFGGVAVNTNFCISNPESRKIVAEHVAEYARVQNNVDFLHIWLADNDNNHCECENCVKMDTFDWYMMLMNDIDDALTALDLDTHIVFISYVDTRWAPRHVMIRNTKRFTMLMAPNRSTNYRETIYFV